MSTIEVGSVSESQALIRPAVSITVVLPVLLDGDQERVSLLATVVHHDVDMRVAFGEGFGYAFAAIVLNNPDARDSFVLNGVHGAGRGTRGGKATGAMHDRADGAAFSRLRDVTQV